MPLTEDEKERVRKNLDRFDAGLADKPILGSIYDSQWREKFREKLFAVDSKNHVSYPSAYSVPLLECLPRCYQYRLEDGALILLSKLSKKEKNHLIKRMRRLHCPSAEEELLLARGFSLEFGQDAIIAADSSRSRVHPEFTLRVNGREFAIEAKGLVDSKRVRLAWQAARLRGENYWVCPIDTTDQDLKRVETAIKKKIVQVCDTGNGILVFTQFSKWPAGDESINLLRNMVLYPRDFRIPDKHCPLAIAFASSCRRIYGVWFNSVIVEKEEIDDLTKERLRSALRQSFYPCIDGVFFNESMSQEDHEKMLEVMRARGRS